MFKTLFVILFIFIFLIYFKSRKENFLINDRFNIKFNQNNEILFLNKDLINIEKSLSETVFKKNNHLFYSNEVIYG